MKSIKDNENYAHSALTLMPDDHFGTTSLLVLFQLNLYQRKFAKLEKKMILNIRIL